MPGQPGRSFGGEEIAAEGVEGSVELYSTILEHSIPAVQLFAHESLEFLRRAADRADARFLQFLGNDGIGIHVDDFALDLVDDGARRAGRRHQPDPGRDVVERRNAGFDRERPDLRQSRQRTAVELGERPQFAALDEPHNRELACTPVFRPLGKPWRMRTCEHACVWPCLHVFWTCVGHQLPGGFAAMRKRQRKSKLDMLDMLDTLDTRRFYEAGEL